MSSTAANSTAPKSAAVPRGRPSPEAVAIGFVAALRAAGTEIAVTSSLLYVESLALVDMADPRAVYWAGRATLVHRPEDIAGYDEVFIRYWTRAADPGSDPVLSVPLTIALDDPAGRPGSEDPDSGAEQILTVRYSATETLARKDFSDYSEAELQEARLLMSRLAWDGPTRRSRRSQPSRSSLGQLDLRHTVRAALRSGGEPVRLHRRVPGSRPRRLVLLVDISGSMENYARALLRFVQAAVAGRSRVEAFALGTRLTRLTRELGSRDPDRAMRAATAAVADWSGGTRLGDGLRTFNDDWGCRGTARGAIVVILSDGWDRGDPALMDEQMQRLSRVTHRVVWVNPLKASRGYQPLARGMAAALPHIDDFVAGHNLESLQELARIVLAEDSRHGGGRRGGQARAGHRQDRRGPTGDDLNDDRNVDRSVGVGSAGNPSVGVRG